MAKHNLFNTWFQLPCANVDQIFPNLLIFWKMTEIFILINSFFWYLKLVFKILIIVYTK